MNKYFQTLFLVFLLLIAFVSITSAQKNKGKINTWTKQIIQSNYDNSVGCLSKVQVAENKGFDRIVFEFKGEINSYSIYYLPSNKDTEGEKITIAGKVFANLFIYATPCDSENYPKGKLKFPLIQQITGGNFEGIQNFVIGVKAKKAYRVQELENTSRLVIDFKH